MNTVAVTMRIDEIADRCESRDAIDARWHLFCDSLQAVPILIPNDEAAARFVLAASDPDAVILTGGGEIQAVKGFADRRDIVEFFLLSWAAQHRRPVLGVCRGMQALLSMEETPVVRLEGHVAARHAIQPDGREVNSFHELGFLQLPASFRELQRAADGSIESCISLDGRLMGIMWHPERNDPFDRRDIGMIARHLFQPVSDRGL